MCLTLLPWAQPGVRTRRRALGVIASELKVQLNFTLNETNFLTNAEHFLLNAAAFFEHNERMLMTTPFRKEFLWFLPDRTQAPKAREVAETRQVLERERPDPVTCDIRLPVKSGPEGLWKVRELRPKRQPRGHDPFSTDWTAYHPLSEAQLFSQEGLGQPSS